VPAQRRTVLAAGLAVLLGGCAQRGAERVVAASTSPSTAAQRATLSLPVLTAWHPSANDFDPACKAAAVREIERRGTGPGREVEIIDAQYGGLLSSTASVLVVSRSWALVNGRLTSAGHTYDVRLSRYGGRWHVGDVYPSHPGAPASISAVAREVLADSRIALPPAARADVRSGLVHDAPLAAMLRLARSFRVGVSVVRSGHPTYVFGTDRLSDHPRGRAFDTWRIDGHAVVAPGTPRSLVTEYMHAAAEAGSYNVGGPYLLGSAPQWFSDRTHHDHVHAGFLT
jgi:hypothetical protein